MTARKSNAAPTILPAPPRHETFRILSRMWDVDLMNAALDEHPDQVVTVETEKAKGSLYGLITVDENRLDVLENPDRPIIGSSVES